MPRSLPCAAFDDLPARQRNALDWITRLLERNRIPYVITGSLAARCWGVTRAPRDIDIDVPQKKIVALAQLLRRFLKEPLNFYRYKTICYFGMVATYRGEQIELTASSLYWRRSGPGSPWRLSPTPLEGKCSVRWKNRWLPILGLPALIAHKRRRNEAKDKKDLRTLVKNLRGTKASSRLPSSTSLAPLTRARPRLPSFDACADTLSPPQRRALEWIVDLLTKHRIPFLLIGGLTARYFGSPRPLRDIDIDMPAEALQALAPKLRRWVHRPLDLQRYPLTVYHGMILRYRGQEIDLGAAESYFRRPNSHTRWEWAPADWEQTISLKWQGRTLRIPTLEKQIALKAYRRDRWDQLDLPWLRRAQKQLRTPS